MTGISLNYINFYHRIYHYNFIILGTSCLFLFCFKSEAELQELIKEVEENPAPPDAPQPPSPGDSKNGKRFSETVISYP